MLSKVMCLVASSVCVHVCMYACMYMYMHIVCLYVTKNWLFGGLSLESLLLCVYSITFSLQCGLLHVHQKWASRAIHAFPNKMQGSLPLEYFWGALTAQHSTAHPLALSPGSLGSNRICVGGKCIWESGDKATHPLGSTIAGWLQWYTVAFQTQPLCEITRAID